MQLLWKALANIASKADNWILLYLVDTRDKTLLYKSLGTLLLFYFILTFE